MGKKALSKPSTAADSPSRASLHGKRPADPLADPKLQQLEVSENAAVAEALYCSELDKLERREGFGIPPSPTFNEKVTAFKNFAQLMVHPTNRRVARVFVSVTLLMVSVPIIALAVGRRLVAPVLGIEEDLCGGLCAVAATVVVMFGYVVFALADEVFDERKQEKAMKGSRKPSSKKRK